MYKKLIIKENFNLKFYSFKSYFRKTRVVLFNYCISKKIFSFVIRYIYFSKKKLFLIKDN